MSEDPVAVRVITSEDPSDVLADIDRTTTDLHDAVGDLWTGGVITGGDAEAFTHQVETLSAELRACVGDAVDGPRGADR